MPDSAPRPIVSPCIRVCRLDADNVCIGCHRTLDEIARWSALTDVERDRIMDRVHREQSRIPPPKTR